MEIIEQRLPSVELIRERRERIEARIAEVAQAHGRDPAQVRIVAVTKTWPAEVARAALAAGLRMLGENRVQEALPKVEAVPEVEWHLIGRLQSNKARKAVAAFPVMHAIDSLDLLRRLEAIATESARRPSVLLQVNVTDESAKAGFPADWFAAEAGTRGELASLLGGLRGVRPSGLMTMARLGASEDEARATFARLRRLRDVLRQSSSLDLPELSMGMTSDMAAAVAEGATLVRIGTALFGARPA